MLCLSKQLKAKSWDRLRLLNRLINCKLYKQTVYFSTTVNIMFYTVEHFTSGGGGRKLSGSMQKTH